ncbi:MAG: hypothetical protein J6T57_00505 [Alphaproteobacteria bacterium]|nr:hypothetical protein [Alphaproteobacteria bacterium]
MPTVAVADFLSGAVVPFPDAPVPISNSNGGWLSAAKFPRGADVLSFTDKMRLKSAGYRPFEDMAAYRGLVVEGEEHFIERQMAMMEIERESDSENMSDAEYCEKYPLDSKRCHVDSETLPGVIAGGNAPSTPVESPSDENFMGQTIGGGVVVASNRTHGGSCYPAAKSDVFKNVVLTTGQYEKSLSPFEKAMITVFRKEGKCGLIKNDPCGYTCYGIGENCAGAGLDVRNMTRADAENLYHEKFWAKYNVGALPDVIAGDIFLASMASGPCTAIKQFRKFLGLGESCKIDSDVVAAVENYNGDIHNDWLNVRQKFLVDVAARRYNNSVLKGWMNAIKLKRENGCHVIPAEPLYR